MGSSTEQPPGGGFTVRRRLPATATRVHRAFVEPAKLEQWFVVPGYRTPAERMRVNAEPGGRMDAVMVADADGSEIPFGFTYAEVDPPHRVVLRFEEPREQVTVTLTEVDPGSVDLVYELVSWPPPSDVAGSRAGVEDMLDRMEAGIRNGVI
jgi:uncharacterized protein YndB with AHSA1/START domain